MNKQQGLVIRPYKRSATSRGSDRELYHLARYLTLVGPRPSLADLDHRRWEKYLAKHDR
jgi:ubiquitin-like domain-containing CTD phosphatase 1